MASARAPYPMLPQKPPQPSCSNLPLNLLPVGIQTSKLMMESLVGFAIAATRQNAGKPDSGIVEPGGVNDPLEIDCADAIVTFGRARPESVSQLVAAVAGADATSQA